MWAGKVKKNMLGSVRAGLRLSIKEDRCIYEHINACLTSTAKNQAYFTVKGAK